MRQGGGKNQGRGDGDSFEGRANVMADGLEVTCDTEITPRIIKDNAKILKKFFFLPEQLINSVMGGYQSRNIFEKIEEELSPVWDIITLIYLLVIPVKFWGKQP